MKATLKGVICGRTIQLAEETGLPDGEVFVVVGIAPSRSPDDSAALAALRRAAGTWADDVDELDRYLAP